MLTMWLSNFLAIKFEILYEANIPYLFLVFPILNILERVFRHIFLACIFSRKQCLLCYGQDVSAKNGLSIVMVSLLHCKKHVRKSDT